LTPALDIGMMNTIPIAYYGLVIGLGIFLGLNGWLYTKVVLVLPKLYGRLPFIPARYNAILPFLLVIPIGYFLPQVIGGGSELILHLSRLATLVRDIDWPLGFALCIFDDFLMERMFLAVFFCRSYPWGQYWAPSMGKQRCLCFLSIRNICRILSFLRWRVISQPSEKHP
jgi:H+/Cl- antiporter ClcA